VENSLPVSLSEDPAPSIPHDWFPGVYTAIPEHMRMALLRYVQDRIQPGHFLTAIICNDLRNAVSRADDQNLQLLKLYLQWFYNIAPAVCHGSYAAMKQWISEAPTHDA
jgi:hypothetical protein